MVHQAWVLRLMGAASMASVALALPSGGSLLDGAPHGRIQHSWCSLGEYGAHLNDSDDLAALERAALESSVDHSAAIKIPVNVFILGEPITQSTLNKSSPVVRLQDSLAAGYSHLGITFGPFKTYHVYDADLAEFEYSPLFSTMSLKMRDRLRIGGAETLNIYIVAKMARGILGFAVFPHVLLKNTRFALSLDGVVLSHHAMTHYLSEKAMVHEVGHWLGLHHPFSGGCLVPDGDGIPDTPQTDERGEQSCTDGKDSCPGLPGVDLVRNYMMYSVCTKNLTFTPGQVSKMRQSWYRFRNPSTRQLPPATSKALRTVPDTPFNPFNRSISQPV